MLTEMLYSPLKEYKSKGTFVTELGGQQMSHTEYLPEALRDGEVFYAIEEGHDDSQLVRISSHHNRSHEITHDREEMKDESFIRDEYGNIFSPILTQKGADFTNPHLFKNSTSTWGYDIYGTQEMGRIPRSIRVSRLLRQECADTEMLTGATQLQEFSWHGQLVDRATFNQLLIQNLDVPDEEKERVLQELETKSLYTTYRRMAVQERYPELFKPKTRNDRQKLLEKVCPAVNVYEHNRAKQFPEYTPQTFDPNVDTDANTYLFRYVPQNLGRNIAIMHGIGLHHGFLHLWNVTALGGIVDLDSVCGEATGFTDDTLIDPELIAADIDRVLYEFRLLTHSSDEGTWIKNKYIDTDSYTTFSREFISSYFKTLLERKRFSYLSLYAFRTHTDALQLADTMNNTTIVQEVEQEIQQQYGEIIPALADLMPLDNLKEKAGNEAIPPSLVAKKNEVLRYDIVGQIILSLYKANHIPMDKKLHDWYLDLLTNEGFLRHTEVTTNNLEEYIYSVFLRAKDDFSLAFAFLPYLESFQDMIAEKDQQKSTHILEELYDTYGRVIPSPTARAAIWSYLREREREDPSVLDHNDPAYLQRVEQIMHSRLAEWAVRDYEERKLSPEGDAIDSENYKLFIMNFMMIDLGPEKIEELMA